MDIQIDKRENLAKYEDVLKQNNYPLKQILDTNGVKTSSLSINSFPSIFLLDNKGKIIFVNIDLNLLSGFLERKL